MKLAKSALKFALEFAKPTIKQLGKVAKRSY